MKVIFPKENGQRYWNIHFTYLLNIFKYVGAEIEFEDREELLVTIDGKDCLFDFSDDARHCPAIKLPVFKFHYNYAGHDNVYPFSPVSFQDWQYYYSKSGEIKYLASGCISYKQRAYANALERRNEVLEILKYGNLNCRISTSLVEQNSYFMEIPDVKAAVFVPGFCNNMLDRAQFQYMAFGVCTISPYIPESLPFMVSIVPNLEYIKCKDDYSDLVDIINNLDQEKCITIGSNAKVLFNATSTPSKLVEWIKTCIN